MSPPLVQEPLPITPRIGQERFVFLICQHGAEATIKTRWTGENRPFRLAFSRPGLLTLKIGEIPPPSPWPTETSRGAANLKLSQDWMIRLSGLALGQVRDSSGGDVNAQLLADQAVALAGDQWDAVHVFERDRELPGIKGFEPGPTPLCSEIGKIICQRLQQPDGAPPLNLSAEPGQRVLDVVLIEPNHWLIGHHVPQQRHERWPGGAYAVPAPGHMVSRAYLKMSEAIAWSGFPIEPDDCIVEIGSAPGGACQRLLDLGLRVTGIDPAEMDPLLLANPRFEHWRGKSSAMRRKMYSKFRWLAADANVAPNYTLDAVEDIVNYKTSRIQGVLLTLKLSSYELAEQLDTYMARVRSWGFSRVEVRQLAANRRECCLVAER